MYAVCDSISDNYKDKQLWYYEPTAVCVTANDLCIASHSFAGQEGLQKSMIKNLFIRRSEIQLVDIAQALYLIRRFMERISGI